MAAFAICLPRFLIVMAGLQPAIHVFLPLTPNLSVIAGHSGSVGMSFRANPQAAARWEGNGMDSGSRRFAACPE
jgi:hypothetical protein